jgi:hypothetical protein
MSKIKFIVRDIDIRPISGSTVRVAFAGGATQDLQSDASGVTNAVPMTASAFGYKVTHPDFAEDAGGGSFEIAQTGPTGSISKGQVLSMKWYQAAGENIVEVCVVLGKIAPPVVNDCWQHPWLALDCALTPIHGTGSKGWDRFHASHDPQPEPLGEFLACEVVGLGLPRLVATWQPKTLDLRANKPVNFLVYFHPYPEKPPSVPYPFDNVNYNVGRNYIGNTRRTAAHMAQKGINAICLVPIFPLSGHPTAYSEITMTQVYRLIREVNFFLQMRAGAQVLTQWRVKQPVGKVAAVCFSRSADAVQSLLTNRGSDAAMASEFFDQKLCEVYGLDPVPDTASTFMAGVARWFRKGTGGRHFRLYTEYDGWVTAYRNHEEELASGPVNHESWTADGLTAQEWHAAGEVFTVAHFPKSYVQPVVDIIRAGQAPSLDKEPNLDVHHFFPGYFMGHALANSSLK